MLFEETTTLLLQMNWCLQFFLKKIWHTQDHTIYSDGQLSNTTTEDLDMFQFVKLTDIWDKLHCVKIHNCTPPPPSPPLCHLMASTWRETVDPQNLQYKHKNRVIMVSLKDYNLQKLGLMSSFLCYYLESQEILWQSSGGKKQEDQRVVC